MKGCADAMARAGKSEGFMSVSVEPRLAARIAWQHFHEGMTQAMIAERLGMTRARVNQIIGELRASGAVQITINTPHGPCVELEAALMDRFGLREAIVVPAPAAGTDVRHVTGVAAGRYLSQCITPGDVVGVSWGGTMDAAAGALDARTGRSHAVVSFCGGFARSTPVNPYDVAARFARILRGPCYYVTAPMFAESQQMRDALTASAAVRETLAEVRNVTIALLSAVDLTAQSRSLEYGIITESQRRELLDAGAVGDVCGHHLTADGTRANHPLNHRTVAADLNDIRTIPHLILASGGLQKVPIIRAALRAGLARSLVTDEAAATALVTAGDDASVEVHALRHA